MTAYFPDFRRPSQASFTLIGNTQSHVSPMTKSTQTIAMPGAMWRASYAWTTLDEDEWRALSAFVADMEGMAGRFYLWPMHAPRLATGSGSPLIWGGGQTGKALSTRNWAANTQAFRAGDFFSYLDTSGRSRLHMATADCYADAAGNALVPLSPPIRRPGNDGGAMQIIQPFGVFMLTGDDAGEITLKKGRLGSITIDMQEALF